MKNPKELYAVVCENGTLFYEPGRLFVFGNHFHAEEAREGIRCAGSESCKCDDHRIVIYTPKSLGSERT